MDLFELFKKFVIDYYYIAIHEEKAKDIGHWIDMCEGVYYFCLLNNLAPGQKLVDFWLHDYNNRFIKLLCEPNFREEEKKRLPKKILTAEEITERNKILEKIIQELKIGD